MALSGSILKSERFVVGVHADTQRRNVFQVQFSGKDGSIFVNFPYFQHSTGIVSQPRWPQARERPPSSLTWADRCHRTLSSIRTIQMAPSCSRKRVA